MDLRDIEIFLTLAEELHFGRTAQRLHVSQARVSQAIKAQERRIGAPLFERTSRKVSLTPLGVRLHADLKAGYELIQTGIHNAVAAAGGSRGPLRLGLFGTQAHDLAPVTKLFKARYPMCELSFREVHFGDPFGPLRRGEIDLQTCWLPVREPDITVGPVVLAEPLALMVGASHPLASRPSVTLEDLGDCRLPAVPEQAPRYWVEAIEPFATPSGRPIARGPVVTTFQEVQAATSAGELVCVVHGDALRYYQRPDIVYLPIEDAPQGRWALIWRTTAETELVRAYAKAARELAGRLRLDATPPG